MVIATSWKVSLQHSRLIQFGIPVYLGHLLVNQQTSWVGSIVVIFTGLVTIGVAAYLYRSFREFKNHSERMGSSYHLEEGETEFEVAPGVRKPGDEQTALVTRTSDDEFFFDEEEEIGG
jgi:hypothetical protein